MTSSTITVRRKGDPQHYVDRKNQNNTLVENTIPERKENNTFEKEYVCYFVVKLGFDILFFQLKGSFSHVPFQRFLKSHVYIFRAFSNSVQRVEFLYISNYSNMIWFRICILCELLGKSPNTCIYVPRIS